MLMLTFFAPKFDEAKLWSTASQVSSEFFFDEVRNSGLGVIRVAKALDQLIEVMLHHTIEERLLRTPWSVLPDAVSTPGFLLAISVTVSMCLKSRRSARPHHRFSDVVRNPETSMSGASSMKIRLASSARVVPPSAKSRFISAGRRAALRRLSYPYGQGPDEALRARLYQPGKVYRPTP